MQLIALLISPVDCFSPTKLIFMPISERNQLNCETDLVSHINLQTDRGCHYNKTTILISASLIWWTNNTLFAILNDLVSYITTFLWYSWNQTKYGEQNLLKKDVWMKFVYYLPKAPILPTLYVNLFDPLPPPWLNSI